MYVPHRPHQLHARAIEWQPRRRPALSVRNDAVHVVAVGPQWGVAGLVVGSNRRPHTVTHSSGGAPRSV